MDAVFESQARVRQFALLLLPAVALTAALGYSGRSGRKPGAGGAVVSGAGGTGTNGGSGSADGAITSCTVSVSQDGTTFTEAATGTWAGDTKIKHVTFAAVPAHYVRLTATAAMGRRPWRRRLRSGPDGKSGLTEH